MITVLLHSVWNIKQNMWNNSRIIQIMYDLQLRLPSSGGSRNFKTGERDPGAVEFLGSGDCFDAP